MKKRAIFVALFMVLMSVSFTQAMPVYQVLDTLGREGSGGPFEIKGITDPSVDFFTFCVEWREHISLGGKYYGSIDPLVYYSSGPDGTSAPIAAGTQSLYNYYLEERSSLSYANMGLIQEAIWGLQGQVTFGSPGVSSNTYYNNWSTLYSPTSNPIVLALNLWKADSATFENRAQSVLKPVPEPGMLVLLGLGLVGVVGICRKLKI